jgi:hypothetical protein
MRRVGLGRHGRIEENAGDPLDGLVNLFDVGIVLAVAFLLAGLAIAAPHGERVEQRPAAGKVRVLAQPQHAPRARGRGRPVGTVYRLGDGRLVIVSPR